MNRIAAATTILFTPAFSSGYCLFYRVVMNEANPLDFSYPLHVQYFLTLK